MICIVRFFKDIYFHIPLGNTRFGIDLNAQNAIGLTRIWFCKRSRKSDPFEIPRSITSDPFLPIGKKTWFMNIDDSFAPMCVTFIINVNIIQLFVYWLGQVCLYLGDNKPKPVLDSKSPKWPLRAHWPLYLKFPRAIISLALNARKIHMVDPNRRTTQ